MTKRFRKSEDGAQVIEFGLVILPLLAFSFLIVDVCWIIFAQAALQHAVREGVRFAVTGQVSSGFKHQDDAIKSVVQANAFGFLSGSAGVGKIAIQYYDPSTLKQLSGVGSNGGGNLLEITVSGVQVTPLAPILRNSSALTLSATSSDVMESSPGGIAPAR